MNKMSMDALNRSWTIGCGTRIHPLNPNLDYALRRDDVKLPPPQGKALARIMAHSTATADTFLSMLTWRSAS